jgi:hypothetical protein
MMPGKGKDKRIPVHSLDRKVELIDWERDERDSASWIRVCITAKIHALESSPCAVGGSEYLKKIHQILLAIHNDLLNGELFFKSRGRKDDSL